MAGGDDLGHYAAQRLAHQPDLFLQMEKQFCHGVGKLAIVPERELIVKGQHRKIPGEPGKVLIEQVGQPNAAREQDQRGFGLGILIVAIGKGFPATDREGGGGISPAKFCKRHQIFLFLFSLPFFVPTGTLFADIKVTAVAGGSQRFGAVEPPAHPVNGHRIQSA